MNNEENEITVWINLNCVHTRDKSKLVFKSKLNVVVIDIGHFILFYMHYVMNNEENKIKSELAVHTETYCRKSDFKPHFQIVNVV